MMNTKCRPFRRLCVGLVLNSVVARVMALLTLAALAACGGGSSSGGGTSTGPLVYTGNTSPALITTTNAGQITANVLGSGGTSSLLLSASTPADGVTSLGRRLNRSVRRSPLPSGTARPLALAVAIDRTEPCEDGGSVRINGTLNDDGTGTLAVAWDDCRQGDDTLSGSATIRVDAFDRVASEITDGTFTFPRLTLRSSGSSADLSGSIRLQVNLASRTEAATANFVTQDGSGQMLKAENLVFTDVFDNISTPTSFVESISGRVFDGVHGFVDIVTNSPFVFGTLTQPFPGSGRITLTGANNAHIRVTAFSTQAVTLGLDLDGNNVFESTATLAWTELSSPAAADLADSDGDGMHNSWETAKGLNPFNSADAADDGDRDGASNLAEYLAGSDPNSAASVPSTLPAPPAPPPSPPAPPGVFTGSTVNLDGVSDLVFDSSRQRIYASGRGNPGRIVPINPVTGAMDAAINVGIDPVKLALSDNGQFLYVGLDGEPAVQRIAVASRTVDLRFTLGNSFVGVCGTNFVEDMQVLPGSPQVVAISRRNDGCSPRHEGVAIYDNGVQRASTTSSHTGSNVIEFSATALRLYGYNNETTEFGFRTMRVDGLGVSVDSVFTSFNGNLISGFGVDIRFAADLIYTTSGRAIDPVSFSVVRTFALPTPFGNLVLPDAALNRVFFLTLEGSTWSLRAFDTTPVSGPTPTVGAERGRVNIPTLTGNPSSLIRWGAKGLAFRTSGGQIFLVESAELIP
jgi:hypothetical protein